MLGENWINEWIDKTTQVFISLGFILVCLTASVMYSIFIDKENAMAADESDTVNVDEEVY
jgi:tellurite resistance protein TerC